jgi:surface carbohydrate biosynthesis protein
MYSKISSFWLYTRHFFKVRKTWRWPKSSDVLIFDVAGEDLLMGYLGQYNPETLDINGVLNMPLLITSFIKGGKRDYAYIDAFIERVKPKLVITFIDNNPIFYLLRSRHPSIKTMFIQNGVRTYYADCFEAIDNIFSDARADFQVDFMLTFGNNTLNKYREYIRGQGMSIGSIKNNINPRRVIKNPNSIGFVSQFRRSKGLFLGSNYVSWEKYAIQMDRLIFLNLLKYADKNSKNLFIIPCAFHDGDRARLEEIAYYENIASRPLQFYEGYRDGMNSYDGVDAAEVVVGIDSALLYESAARKNKTGIFSFRGKLLGVEGLDFGWPGKYPPQGPFWSNLDDYPSFKRIMDYLFSIDENDWQEVLRLNTFDDVMYYDSGNSILQKILGEELKNHKT